MIQMILILVIAGCSFSTGETAPTTTPSQPAAAAPPAVKKPTRTAKPTISPTPIPEGTVKILFIGNSFTFFYDMPGIFTQMMEAGGYPVYAAEATEPGFRLSQHLESKNTLAMIESQKWDYIVLQENSHNLETERLLAGEMYPAVRQLDALIKKNGAQTVLFVTWADKFTFSEKGYASLAEMQSHITSSYTQIAAEVNAAAAPAGPAWMMASSQNPELELWDGDANHPSLLGSYLNACVFYAFFTQTSPEESGYTHNLPPEIAQALQAAAAEAVLGEQ